MVTRTPPPGDAAQFKASSIMLTLNVAKVGVMALPDLPGVAGAVLGAIGRRGVNAHFVVELSDNAHRSHIVFGVSENDLGEALAAMQDIADKVQASEVVHQRDVVLVSIHGPHFRDRPGCAAEAFAAIADAGVNILAISTSVSSISCVVERRHLDLVIESLQKHFGVTDDGVLVAEDGLARPWRLCR
jgi:aspartate kinase